MIDGQRKTDTEDGTRFGSRGGSQVDPGTGFLLVYRKRYAMLCGYSLRLVAPQTRHTHTKAPRQHTNSSSRTKPNEEAKRFSASVSRALHTVTELCDLIQPNTSMYTTNTQHTTWYAGKYVPSVSVYVCNELNECTDPDGWVCTLCTMIMCMCACVCVYVSSGVELWRCEGECGCCRRLVRTNRRVHSRM